MLCTSCPPICNVLNLHDFCPVSGRIRGRTWCQPAFWRLKLALWMGLLASSGCPRTVSKPSRD
eukprot:9777825-Karenia_brevis.AAC.1